MEGGKEGDGEQQEGKEGEEGAGGEAGEAGEEVEEGEEEKGAEENEEVAEVAYYGAFTEGSVVGVLLDMDRGVIRFYKDGNDLGEAFSDDALKLGELYPLFKTS